MVEIILVETPLKSWPQDKNGDYIFHSSEDAIALGRLIVDDQEIQYEIATSRSRILTEIIKYRKTLDYQKMMDLAVEAQFCRECLEEARKK